MERAGGHPRHGELRDLEHSAGYSDEDRRVLVLLALSMHQLEAEDLRVPIDRALEVRDGEREVKDVGDHGQYPSVS